jgi:IMP dehydrogenase
MAKISPEISESLREYLILTDWVRAKPEEVSLEARLGPIVLQYPYMTARMQCVVGHKMAVAAGRLGILTMVPRSLRDQDKQEILDANNKARLRKGDIEFVDDPITAKPDDTLESVTQKVERIGHSVIPVVDRKSKLYGVYVHDPDHPPAVSPSTPVIEVMLPLRKQGSKKGIPYVQSENEGKIKKILAEEEKNFLAIVDRNMILQKIAFLQKFDTNYIGIAISTRGNWEEELEKRGRQADTLTIDSSNACFDDAIKILKAAKKKFPDKPFGIGNIIQGKHFKIFAKEGADYIIGGMGVGSICKTGSERGNGRGQFTVAKELAQARDEYYMETGRYVYSVIDGGIGNRKDMTVGLAWADFIMMGNYFNRFYEAAARKLDESEEPTSEEALIRYVETWGEGHPRARLVAMFGMNFEEALRNPSSEAVSRVVERYGHSSISSATIEGVVGITEYRGRLKPCVETDARYIRTTISNTGASNLREFRNNAVLEKASPETIRDMYPHDVEVKEK